MNTIESKSKLSNRHRAGTKTAVLLVSFVLAAGTVVCLNAQELTVSITNSARLEWPVPAEDCIVVGANSLASNAVWTSWPEPIYKRFGELCMAVPTTNTQQFFKLVPGTQFIDDFDSPKWPYASKGEWVPYFYSSADATRFEVTHVDDALRIRTVNPAVDGRVLVLPPGPDVVLADFYASVDITDWPVRGTFGIGARGQRAANFPGDSNGYIGQVTRNPAQLVIWDGGSDVPGPAFTYDPATDYRLVFSGVGRDLSLRLVNRTTGSNVCQMTVRNSRWSQGMVLFWADSGRGGSYDITVDNFYATGTKP